MASIIYAEEYFYPEGWGGAQLSRDIVKALQRDGHQVAVVCGSVPYIQPASSTTSDHSLLGIKIIRLVTLARSRFLHLRVSNHLLFSLQCFAALLMEQDVDLIIVQTNPPPIVVIGGLAAWLRRKPLVIIAMDIYPNAFLAFWPALAGTFLAKILSIPFDWAYRSAKFVVALGPCMADLLCEKHVQRNRIRIIPNWATGNLDIRRGAKNQLLNQWQLKGCFTILYSGSLGIAHEIDTILASLIALRSSCPYLRMLCVARGTRLPAARKAVEAANLEDLVIFRDLVIPDLLPETMGIASIALVSIRPGFEGVVVPSKLAGYLARGIPVLYIGPNSDISQLIQDSKSGACFINGDALGVCKFLQRLTAEPALLSAYALAAKSYYDNNLAIDHGQSAYCATVKDAIIC